MRLKIPKGKTQRQWLAEQKQERQRGIEVDAAFQALVARLRQASPEERVLLAPELRQFFAVNGCRQLCSDSVLLENVLLLADDIDDVRLHYDIQAAMKASALKNEPNMIVQIPRFPPEIERETVRVLQGSMSRLTEEERALRLKLQRGMLELDVPGGGALFKEAVIEAARYFKMVEE